MNREEHRSDRSHRRVKSPEVLKHRRRSPEKKFVVFLINPEVTPCFRPKDPDKIDKRKLLEIARRNAKKLISAGIVTNDKMVSITSGGKTVSELTGFFFFV